MKMTLRGLHPLNQEKMLQNHESHPPNARNNPLIFSFPNLIKSGLEIIFPLHKFSTRRTRHILDCILHILILALWKHHGILPA